MKKSTFKAFSDIALVKYWGKKDEVLRLPENGSVSIVLEGLTTTTTVEFQDDLELDLVSIQSENISSESREYKRVSKHLDRIRKIANIDAFAKVVSTNSFPRSTGLSSSGSGMAALTYSALSAAKKYFDQQTPVQQALTDLSEKEISILARQASGTACRCSCGGFVEWRDSDTSEESYSKTIFSQDHWDIRDVIAIVDEGKKRFSSTKGHTTAQSSKFFEVRQMGMGKKIEDVKQSIADRDFTRLGSLVEAEALEFHSILLTSQPPLIAWYPGTLEVMLAVEKMRQDGIEAYYTINTGFNVHVLTLPEFEIEVQKRLVGLPLVKNTILAKVGQKPHEVEDHLF